MLIIFEAQLFLIQVVVLGIQFWSMSALGGTNNDIYRSQETRFHMPHSHEEDKEQSLLKIGEGGALCYNLQKQQKLTLFQAVIYCYQHDMDSYGFYNFHLQHSHEQQNLLLCYTQMR